MVYVCAWYGPDAAPYSFICEINRERNFHIYIIYNTPCAHVFYYYRRAEWIENLVSANTRPPPTHRHPNAHNCPIPYFILLLYYVIIVFSLQLSARSANVILLLLLWLFQCIYRGDFRGDLNECERELINARSGSANVFYYTPSAIFAAVALGKRVLFVYKSTCTAESIYINFASWAQVYVYCVRACIRVLW